MADLHASNGSIGSRALRLAVANLVRLANADLSTARLLLREGRVRHAAGLADTARMYMIRAIAASEARPGGRAGTLDFSKRFFLRNRKYIMHLAAFMNRR
jgi:hypothetical protein